MLSRTKIFNKSTVAGELVSLFVIIACFGILWMWPRPSGKKVSISRVDPNPISRDVPAHISLRGGGRGGFTSAVLSELRMPTFRKNKARNDLEGQT
jgi:hypothetical protein